MKPLKVTEVTKYVNRLVTMDPILNRIRVEGEIADFHARENIVYLSLKDDASSLRCVIYLDAFRGEKKDLFDLEDGLQVVADGTLSVYAKKSIVQLNVLSLEVLGTGSGREDYNKLRARLYRLGYFERSHKIPLPTIPQRIGIVTSAAGAAIQDIFQVLKRRYPIADVLVCPVTVQGSRAANEVVRGIEILDEKKEVDVIIVARGGGSTEDLSVFNDELVVEAIFRCHTPIVTAIGHQIDISLADLTADVSAATPTEAAELVVPDSKDLMKDLNTQLLRLTSSIAGRIESNEMTLQLLKSRLQLKSPVERFHEKSERATSLVRRLEKSICLRLEEAERELSATRKLLEAVNPEAWLKKGYAIVYDKNDQVVSTVDGVTDGDCLRIRVTDGWIGAMVKEKEK